MNKRNCYMLSNKRANSDIIERSPRNKIRSNKKLNSLPSGNNPKNQGNNNGPENYIEINDVSLDKSNNVNNNHSRIPKN